jgi:hypothetical protein
VTVSNTEGKTGTDGITEQGAEENIVTCQPIVGLRNSGCDPVLSDSSVNRFPRTHDEVIPGVWEMSRDLYVSASTVTYPPAATVA